MNEKKKTTVFHGDDKSASEKSVKKQNIFRSAIALCVIALVSALLLSTLNEVMNVEERNKTDADMVAVMRRIMPGEEYKEVENGYKKTDEIRKVYEVYDEADVLLGYCVEVEVKDYMDTMSFAVAVDRQNTVCAVEIMKMSENAGTGIKVKNPEFLNSFKGKTGMISAIKGTPKDNSHISVISGATVSSKAVAKGVSEAVASVSQIEAAKAAAEKTETDETTSASQVTTAEENNGEGEVQAE